MIEELLIGMRIFFVDRKNSLLFTKKELQVARKRYEKELAKKLSKE